VGSIVAEEPIGVTQQLPEPANVHENPPKPHDGQSSQIRLQSAALVFHPGTTKADTFNSWSQSAQGTNEIGSVQIAAGLADRKKDSHCDYN
jgi:hypothetical protein